jgi:ribosomal-protein-serine acetyltransferase
LNFKVSEHICLSALMADDAEAILSLVDLNRAQLGRYLYWVKEVTCIKSAKKYITERVNSGLAGAQWYKILFNNKTVGIFAIKSISTESKVAELGYWLTNEVQGLGVMSQIIAKLRDLLSRCDVEALEFRCLSENTSSINVAKRAGAQFINTLPNYMVANEVEQDLNIYHLVL